MYSYNIHNSTTNNNGEKILQFNPNQEGQGKKTNFLFVHASQHLDIAFILLLFLTLPL